jgi:hypothetical protein
VAWQITESGGAWVYDPDLSHASEFEATFREQPDGQTRVELEHRYIERHGGPQRLAPPVSGVMAFAADCYLRMLTARATTRATVTIEMADCAVMPIFAQRDSGMTSVGLKAAALVNDRYR